MAAQERTDHRGNEAEAGQALNRKDPHRKCQIFRHQEKKQKKHKLAPEIPPINPDTTAEKHTLRSRTDHPNIMSKS